jgi:hypothetical protein
MGVVVGKMTFFVVGVLPYQMSIAVRNSLASKQLANILQTENITKYKKIYLLNDLTGGYGAAFQGQVLSGNYHIQLITLNSVEERLTPTPKSKANITISESNEKIIIRNQLPTHTHLFFLYDNLPSLAENDTITIRELTYRFEKWKGRFSAVQNKQIKLPENTFEISINKKTPSLLIYYDFEKEKYNIYPINLSTQ